MQSTLSQLGHNTRSCELIAKEMREHNRGLYKFHKDKLPMHYKLIEDNIDPREIKVNFLDTSKSKEILQKKMNDNEMSKYSKPKTEYTHSSEMRIDEDHTFYNSDGLQVFNSYVSWYMYA